MGIMQIQTQPNTLPTNTMHGRIENANDQGISTETTSPIASLAKPGPQQLDSPAPLSDASESLH